MNKIIFAINIVIVLVVVNWAIFNKEQQLKSDNIVYLELAPVDPRSLMQGDYMRMEYVLANEVAEHLDRKLNSDGQVLVSLSDKRLVQFKALVDESVNAGHKEIILDYRVRKGRVKFASNEFFFQEGKAKQYENARYAKFAVAENGEVLLVDLLAELP